MNTLSEQAETLQNLLVAHATGGSESDLEYRQLRQVFMSTPAYERLLPQFVRTCRSLSQFWEMIKYKFAHYAERRRFIWEEFQPLLQELERQTPIPADGQVGEVLESFDAPHVHAAWSKALDRRAADPEGAITSARTLLESVCKHILDDLGTEYGDADLPKLYKLAAEGMNLAPSQHTETVFRQILGGCAAVVEGLGAVRNRLSDAHGKGRSPIRPAARHAELAVNLAGAMSSFLIATWEARHEVQA